MGKFVTEKKLTVFVEPRFFGLYLLNPANSTYFEHYFFLEMEEILTLVAQTAAADAAKNEGRRC